MPRIQLKEVSEQSINRRVHFIATTTMQVPQPSLSIEKTEKLEGTYLPPQ